jgi:hypothetical protein
MFGTAIKDTSTSDDPNTQQGNTSHSEVEKGPKINELSQEALARHLKNKHIARVWYVIGHLIIKNTA